MTEKFLAKNKKEFLKNFKSIKSVNDKFIFWEKHLKVKYIYFFIATSNSVSSLGSRYTEPYKELYDFRIIATENEILIYNDLILKKYVETFQMNPKNSKLYNLDILKDDFENKLIDVINKKDYIEQEINKLNLQVIKLSSPCVPYSSLDTSHTFFSAGFKQNYYNNIELDLSKRAFYDIENIVAYLNGEVISIFLKYIKSTLENLNPKKLKSDESLSIQEQILILDYLGVLNEISTINTDEKKAKLISLLIGKNYQNTRALISSIYSLKHSKVPAEKRVINKRLVKIAELFKTVGLLNLSDTVESDLGL